MSLLNTYLKLEKKINMEYMLKEQIYITYYEKFSDFKNDSFFLDDYELKSFLNDYELNKIELIQPFIMLHDKTLDVYVVWTEADSLKSVLDYFSNNPKYKVFII